ncbi:hypothetical protein MLD38_032780 [Melastoma candidum]|uniref:Uncharacterized protein n=1 Tax=Melastoma candidum TaxID=119954 RepID=A0ACB9M8Y7_9MYRT|nr:hypothetical protein MLD38_032780 [Melastoma candidum]
MLRIEDPAIRLFGKKIPLLGNDVRTCQVKLEEEEETGDNDQGETEQIIAVDARSQSQVPSVIEEGMEKSETSKPVKEPSETSDPHGKTMKKPDKILSCPRCNSMDTKFCYYNNYNVNQPRHFCRACQRYWTAGGSMRSMPVGAGRRKTKSAQCRRRRIMISGTLVGAKVGVSDCIQLPHLKSNRVEPRFAGDNGKQGNECSSASSITTSNPADNRSKLFASQEGKAPNCTGIPSQIPCLPGFPWSYPWNPAVPAPAFYPAAAFWTWNVPLVSSQQSPFSSGQNATFASTDSAISGKRSREPEPEIQSPKQGNGCLIKPKTLGINDPKEAAKSSIWTSLGIARDSTIKGASSCGFKQKGVEKVQDAEKLPALHANPAALSRSCIFRSSN